MFMLLSKFDLPKSLEWYYNEPHHGKGEMTETGGKEKDLAFFRAVKSKKFCKNTRRVCQCCELVIPSISSIRFPMPKILVEPPEEANRPPNLKPS